jgi:O-antigen ligase
VSKSVVNSASTKIKLFGQKKYPYFSTAHLLPQFGIAVIVGLILGLTALALPLGAVPGVLAVFLSVYIVLKRPELALVGILVLTSSILFEDQMPRISFGVSFHLSDLLLFGMLGVILVRLVVEKDFRLVRTPLDTPLWLFIGITILSTLIAVFQSSVEAELARRSIRVFSYYLTFFILTQLVREPRQLKLLLFSILTIAIVVAMAMVAQFILGDSVQILPGRVEALVTQNTSYDDITRILPPGWSTVMISFMVIVCLFAIEKSPLRASFNLILLLVFGIALILTFLRSFWGALMVVTALLFFLLNNNERARFIVATLTLASLGAIILLIVFVDPESRAARLVLASTDRLATLGETETFQGGDSSLNWRLIENEYAYAAIAQHPMIGLGMGTPYRPLDFRLDYRNADGTITNGSSFIHNGHLRIMLQSGLVGYLSLVWLSGLFLSRGFKFWRNLTDDRMKAVVLGSLLVYLAIIIAAVANSTFMQWRWTPLLGMIYGVNEVIYRFYLPAYEPLAADHTN